MRKVAAHRIVTPRETIVLGLCTILGDEVVETRPLTGEEAMVEWMDGSIVCRELLGLSGKDSPAPAARTEEYYKKRPCAEICAVSAQILAEKLGLTERIN